MKKKTSMPSKHYGKDFILFQFDDEVKSLT